MLKYQKINKHNLTNLKFETVSSLSCGIFAVRYHFKIFSVIIKTKSVIYFGRLFSLTNLVSHYKI